jgi:hypothetical protein
LTLNSQFRKRQWLPILPPFGWNIFAADSERNNSANYCRVGITITSRRNSDCNGFDEVGQMMRGAPDAKWNRVWRGNQRSVSERFGNDINFQIARCLRR